MRFSSMAAWVLASLATWGCEPMSITASPDCHASVLHERVLGWPRLRTVVFVIDPSLRGVLREERLLEVRAALRDAVEILVTGDRQLDGERDFGVDEGVRLVVTTTDGRLLLESIPPPSEIPSNARPLADPWIELWPDADSAWTRWFLDVTALRIEAALEAPIVEDADAAGSTLTLAESSITNPDWAAHVVLVTARDARIEASTATRWSRALPGSSLTLVGALPRAAHVPPFEPLLGAQPFDEAAVSCAAGELVGVYPRRLLSLPRDLALAGHAVSVSSLCHVEPAELMDVAVARIADGLRDPCLPFPLTLRADGTPPCALELTLPVSGRGTSCAELALPRLRQSRDEHGRLRDVCAVPSVPRGDVALVPGFYYDDFSPDLADTCGARPHRLAFTAALRRPAGASVEWWCEEGSAACGFEVVSERVVSRDAGRD